MTNTRYAPGGDIYEKLKKEYGTDAANKVWRAAQTGEGGAIAAALGEIRNGPKLNESTSSIFLDQIMTDPLAAPLESANNQLGKAFWNIVKNPYVALALVGLLIFVAYKNNWLRFKTRVI